jgi:tetratricopeptide (TPR) repeat protein
MLELIIIAAAIVMFRRQLVALGASAAPAPVMPFVPRKASPQLTQLADYADRLYAEKKWLAAEKAYLNVLKADHKNVTAYSHLGIIYSTQKNLADAIECFEIAARLKPGGSTYQNLGLGYFENRNYMKAIAAFEKALMFEPTAQRHIALARAYKKISKTIPALAALERAAELDSSPKVLQLLADAYAEAGRKDDAAAVVARMRQPAGASQT